MATLFILPLQVPVSSAGRPYAGAYAYFYAAGTTTHQIVYSDIDLTTAHAQPVVADAYGRFPAIYLNPNATANYRVQIKTSAGVLIYDQDNVPKTELSQSSIGQYLYPITAAETAASVTPSDYAYPPGDVRRYGAVGDGVTDDSSALQDAIDSNKGARVVIPDGSYLCAGLTLDGSSYNGTEIRSTGGELKLKADAGAATFGSAWVGLLVKGCDRVTLDLRWDGNRSAMTDREQVFCVGVAGATNLYIPQLRIREVSGDGLYISQSSWTASGTVPRGVVIDSISVVNSADDGRNAVSIISGDDITIGNIYSYQVGGTISATNMPGGLVVEPNETYQYCRNIVVGNCNVVTAGTSGLSILGVAVTDDATGDWNVQRVRIGNFNIRRTGSTTSSGLTVSRVFDLTASGTVTHATTRGKGAAVDYADRVTLDLEVYNVTQGINVGPEGTVKDFDIEVNVNDYSISGLRTTGVTRGTFQGRIYGASSATNTYAIQCHAESRTVTQTNVMYGVDCPFDGSNVRAFRNEVGQTVSYSNCRIQNCDYSGYTSFSVQCDAQIPSVNVRGRNEASAIPANGAWFIGDRVYSTAPTEDGSNMVLLGWIRLTTGAANVSGTDWELMHVSTVSPAT